MTLRQKNIEIYWAWKSMKQRTQNPKCSAYKNYGARGIRVCKEWQIFEPFCKWALSAGWNKGLDLDRINNDGNYCPENCAKEDKRSDKKRIYAKRLFIFARNPSKRRRKRMHL